MPEYVNHGSLATSLSETINASANDLPLPVYTVATMPTNDPIGSIIIVSDAVGVGAPGTLAFSNGTIYIDVHTGLTPTATPP